MSKMWRRNRNMKLCLAGTYARKELMNYKAPKYVLESFWRRY